MRQDKREREVSGNKADLMGKVTGVYWHVYTLVGSVISHILSNHIVSVYTAAPE